MHVGERMNRNRSGRFVLLFEPCSSMSRGMFPYQSIYFSIGINLFMYYLYNKDIVPRRCDAAISP